MLGLTGFWIFILCAIAVGIGFLVVLISTSLIVFSRVAFSLLAALIAVQNIGIVLVPDSGFLNYVAWLIFFLAAVFLLSKLPRVDFALKFFSTFFIANFVIEFVVMIFGGIFASIADAEFQINLGFEIIIKLICLAFSIFAWITNAKKAAYDAPASFTANVLDKAFAAITYGVSIAFLFVSFNQNWEWHWLVMLIILVVGAVAAFVADMCIGGNYLFAEHKKTVVVPR